MDSKQLGENIKKYRLLRELTQEELAARCGMSTDYYRHLEYGIKTPSLDYFIKISEALNVSADLLLEGIINYEPGKEDVNIQEKINHLSDQQKKIVCNSVELLIKGFETK